MLLVGLVSGQPDTTVGAFLIVVRDFSDTPMPGEQVEFRLQNCPGARLAADQRQPGVTSRCSTNGILAITDSNGIVRFAAVGGGAPTGLHGTGPCAQVYAMGIPLGTVRVAYLDLDGSGGMGANHISIWLSDFGTGEPIGRSDFNGDLVLTADDLSVWFGIWGLGNQSESPAAYCL